MLPGEPSLSGAAGNGGRRIGCRPDPHTVQEEHRSLRVDRRRRSTDPLERERVADIAVVEIGDRELRSQTYCSTSTEDVAQ
jgi:hypothetical protein